MELYCVKQLISATTAVRARAAEPPPASRSSGLLPTSVICQACQATAFPSGWDCPAAWVWPPPPQTVSARAWAYALHF